MPMTTRAVARKWTKTVLRSSFSRPNLGQMRVRRRPRKKITMGSAESEATEARATAGAKVRAPR